MLKILVTATFCAASGFAAAQQTSNSPATSVTAAPALLQITGGVIVNQRPVTTTTSTIFAGDKIETASSGAVRISAPGLALYLPSNSCVTYRVHELEICGCGSVEVNAVKPVSVTYRDRDIALSSNAKSSFTMSIASPNLEVTNRDGSILIAKTGSVLTRLTAKTSRSFDGLGCSVPAANLVSKKAIGTAAAAVAASAAIAIAVIKSANDRPPISSFSP